MNQDQAFRAVAESFEKNAPVSIENGLRVEFRKQVRRRRLVRWSLAGGAAVLAASLAALALIPLPPEAPPPELRIGHVGVPPEIAVAARTPPPRTRASRKSRVAREVPQTQARFYALPNAGDMAPMEYGSVVRLELPRSALRAVGLPVNEDRFAERVQADVLIGQDGLARAVRFVQ